MYCSFYQGASSSFHMHIGVPFLSDRKPGNIQKLFINNSLSTSVKTHAFRNPAGVCGHRRSHLGTCWCQFVHCSVFSKRKRQCANLCCFVAKGNMGSFTHPFCGCPGGVFFLEMYPFNIKWWIKIWPNLNAVTTIKNIKHVNGDKVVF